MTTGMRRGPLVLAVTAMLSAACPLDDISAPAEGTVFVQMRDSFFQPQTVTVPRGRSVRWTNDGAMVHSVVSDSGLFHSDLMSPTRWFDVRFDNLGTFAYHCSRHGGMTGQLTVQ